MSLSKPSEFLGTLTAFLETRSGRDKAFRIIGYVSKTVFGFLAQYKDPLSPGAKKLRVLSEAISNFRVMLRLLDGIPMLHYTLSYGLGSSEPDRLLRFCNVLQNVLYLIYYPCEHIAWASSLSLVEADTLAWMYRSDWLWVFALIFALISYIHQYIVASKEEAKLKTVLRNAVKKDLDGKTSVTSVIDQLSIARAKKNRALLNILQDGSDFMNAVNWLPAGYLWAEKFPTYLVGVFGVISSVCGIYKAWPGK